MPATTERKTTTARDDSKRQKKNATPTGEAFCTENATTAARTMIAHTRNTISHPPHAVRLNLPYSTAKNGDCAVSNRSAKLPHAYLTGLD